MSESMVTPEELAAMRAVVEAATNGPWRVFEGPSFVGGGADLMIETATGEWLANMEHRMCPTIREAVVDGGSNHDPDAPCPICTIDSGEITREQRANAVHIALFDPTLVARLLDTIDALEAVINAIPYSEGPP